MFTDDQLLPISALQHLLFCPRQCALIHLEQAWAENYLTADGRVLHDKAHDGPDESRAGVRITRGMSVRSLRLGLSGQCDVVELHADGQVLPVEYKRGKPKSHRADEVQVCAQALCLEEMLGLGAGAIQRACLFYGEPKRRHDVLLDEDLHRLTEDTADQLHAMIRERITPQAEYAPGKCDACSLIDHCQPHALRFKRGAAAWFSARLNETANAAKLTPEC
jgi:CRISPR-associated exonuclease Cas4